MNKTGYSPETAQGRDVGIVILAAGNSSRLGQPKQLLPYQGKTLLTHAVTEALAAFLQPAVVVTGAFQAEIVASLQRQAEMSAPSQHLAVNIVHNPHWETGMASGIVAGLDKAISIQPRLQAIIVAVCDQPYLSAALLQALVAKHTVSEKGLIASGYSGTAGTPVLFDRRYFKELSRLSGDGGAKSLLKRYPDDVSIIPFPKGNIDIDTEDDFQRLTIGG